MLGALSSSFAASESLVASRAEGCEGGPSPFQAIKYGSLPVDEYAVMADRFGSWLRFNAMPLDRSVRNLVYSVYDLQARRGLWIAPYLTAKASLWHLQRGAATDAAALLRGLVRWQQVSREGPLARSYGAFPHRIDFDQGNWHPSDYFYSGENLVILEALTAAYERTKEPDFLNSAIGIGTWLVEVMCRGHRLGGWAEDHAAPMAYVRASGDLSPVLYTNLEMAWLMALRHLGRVTREPAYCRQSDRAYEFLRQAQRPTGTYMDHYEPGTPPQRYTPDGWKPSQGRQLLASSLLRAAVGASRYGDIEAARRLFGFIKLEGAGVPGIIDLESGKHGFASEAAAYWDIAATGLYRSVAQWVGDRPAAVAAMGALKKAQELNGAFCWGIQRATGKGVEPRYSPLAGFWATGDLSFAIA